MKTKVKKTKTKRNKKPKSADSPFFDLVNMFEFLKKELEAKEMQLEMLSAALGKYAKFEGNRPNEARIVLDFFYTLRSMDR